MAAAVFEQNKQIKTIHLTLCLLAQRGFRSRFCRRGRSHVICISGVTRRMHLMLFTESAFWIFSEIVDWSKNSKFSLCYIAVCQSEFLAVKVSNRQFGAVGANVHSSPGVRVCVRSRCFWFFGAGNSACTESHHAPLIHLWPNPWMGCVRRARRRRLLPIDTSDTLFLMPVVAWIMHEKLTPRRFAKRGCSIFYVYVCIGHFYGRRRKKMMREYCRNN